MATTDQASKPGTTISIAALNDDESVLEGAARHLALVDRAESPAERATLLFSVEAMLLYARTQLPLDTNERAQLQSLDTKLSAYKAVTPPTDRE